MKYRSLLITGGAGFIGSNLAVGFKQKYPRLKVYALDNLSRRGSELNLVRLKENNIKFIRADVRNPKELVLKFDLDLMLECSAEPSVMAGRDDPLYIINNNLVGTVNCLELCRKHKADIVFLSTSRVYPYQKINQIKISRDPTRFRWLPAGHLPGWSLNGISEDFTTCGPKTLYGATKLASEMLLQEYIANYGIKGVINRCGVIAGPWQFGKVDQGVFTYWMLAHYFKRPLKYIGFGGKGKQVRDLLHVDDLFGLIDLEVAQLSNINGQIYNVGGGDKVNLSLCEATALCQQITGNKISIGSELNTRPGDIAIYLSDNRKVSCELRWQPKKTAKTILSDIYRWIETTGSLRKI
ncbi:MAG TPA: NAD-dependent epimerase/dehydratase family protein [Candidatus Omnitrophota bacterium]|nr:NAD-dependent epimerase/dehydratase family protein [Candidatus Omnitrophota bacterium]